MKYLFLSPHPDDVELACGATIAKIISENSQASIAVFSDCEIDLEEMNRSHEILGVETYYYNLPRRNFDKHRQNILDILINLRKQLDPDVIFIPDQSDIHQDHQVIGMEALRAFKLSPSVLAYAHPHNQMDSAFNYYEVVDKDHLDRKLGALSKFVSQKGRYYFNPDSIVSVMKYYGLQVGCEFAEAFKIIRHIQY